MRHRILALVGSVALAVTALLGAASPAVADHNVVNGHWPVYRYNNVRDTLNRRTFWVFDRTGNPAFWSMLNDIARDFNNRPENQNGTLPLIAPYQDTANVGTCYASGTDAAPNLIYGANAYSVLLLCERELDPSFGSGVLGVTWSNCYQSPNCHLTQYLPAILMDTQHPYEQAKAALYHELGHGMGLEHSGDGDALMYPSINYYPKVMSAHDILALTNFYYNHPRD